jgi:nucleotide-binding universal stress UspA family protein
MKKILVPTDFSECANYAAQVAMSIAARTKASIHFLHIMPNPNEDFHVPHGPGVSIRSAQKIEARNALNELCSKAAHTGLEASQLLVFDKGNERIENYVDPLHIDLIIMGSHGASGIRELVIGSNTQRVVRHASVPVLVVKGTGTSAFSIKNMLYASTFQGDDQHALMLVTSFANLWKATVNILLISIREGGVNEVDQDKIVNQLKEKYPTINFTSNKIEVNDEEWGIHQFARLIDADMIILNTEEPRGFMFHRNIAEELVNHEQKPVLVINKVYSRTEA